MPSSCLFSGIKKTEGLPEAVQVSFGSGMFFLFKERFYCLRVGIIILRQKISVIINDNRVTRLIITHTTTGSYFFIPLSLILLDFLVYPHHNHGQGLQSS